MYTADSPAQAIDPVHTLSLEAERLGPGGRRRLIEQLVASERLESAREREAAAIGHAALGKAVEVSEASGASTSYAGEISLENIDDVMRYQPWNRAQQDAGAQVREALTMAARVILRVCPAGPGDRSFRATAIREVLNARVHANSAISFRGRF